MRLNSIKLSGFKSFAEPTNFLLPGQPQLWHSFHIADYGLFYANIRQNAVTRVRAWQAKAK